MLVRNLQLPTTINHIGSQSVQLFNFSLSATFTKVLLGNIPKGITLDHRMDTVIRLGTFIRRINNRAAIGKNESAWVLICRSLRIGKIEENNCRSKYTAVTDNIGIQNMCDAHQSENQHLTADALKAVILFAWAATPTQAYLPVRGTTYTSLAVSIGMLPGSPNRSGCPHPDNTEWKSRPNPQGTVWKSRY